MINSRKLYHGIFIINIKTDACFGNNALSEVNRNRTIDSVLYWLIGRRKRPRPVAPLIHQRLGNGEPVEANTGSVEL